MAPEHATFWQEEAKDFTPAQLAKKIADVQRDIETTNAAHYPTLYEFATAKLPILLAEQSSRNGGES